jgi:hypothetical protein
MCSSERAARTSATAEDRETPCALASHDTAERCPSRWCKPRRSISAR